MGVSREVGWVWEAGPGNLTAFLLQWFPSVFKTVRRLDSYQE